MSSVFADYTFIFSVAHNPVELVNTMNKGLSITRNLVLQWKMSPNFDRSKPVQEIIFPRKTSTISHVLLTFN